MKWTYEMNKDLYRMYIKADKKQRGYQKRLKTLWDKDYPRETHVNEKQLAQQIRNIQQKQLIPEIELKRIEQEMGELNTPGDNNLGETNPIQKRINNNEQNTNNQTSDETFGTDLDTDIELDLTPGDVNNRPDIAQQQNSMDIGTDEQSIIYREDLREIWRKNFEKYIDMDIEHREFSTKVTPPPAQKIPDILNKIVEEEIMRLEKEHQLDLWTINVIYYTSAVSFYHHFISKHLVYIKKDVIIQEKI